MRLICPNCAAQYEVDEGVIPEVGRDVQCSNCGHTWWQQRLEAVAAEAPVAEAVGNGEPAPVEAAPPGGGATAEAARWPEEDAPWEDEEPVPGPSLGQAPQTWPEAPDEHAAAAANAGQAWPEAPPEAVGAPAAAPPQARPQRSLDEAVLDVLRQEAEREARARQTEGGASVESQTDLGLAEAPDGSGVDAAARERVERMNSPDGAEADAEDEALRPERRQRRSKLPDVDEINSTLAGQQAAQAAESGTVPMVAAHRRRSGFRTGFTLMILVAISTGAVYSYADKIVAAAPGTAPAMQVFVRSLDSARLWLDKAALSATEAITKLTEND